MDTFQSTTVFMGTTIFFFSPPVSSGANIWRHEAERLGIEPNYPNLSRCKTAIKKALTEQFADAKARRKLPDLFGEDS